MLALQGALNISVNGIVARLEAEEGTMRLDVNDPVSFLRGTQLFHTGNLSVLRLLAEQLSQNGITLTIVSKSRTLVVIGHAVKGGMASSLLGVPRLEIRAAGLLRRITG